MPEVSSGPRTACTSWLINGSRVVEDQRWRGFIQELHIARDLGLLTFSAEPSSRPNLATPTPTITSRRYWTSR